uniref:DesA/ISL3 alpha bundle tail domain-containing protein n=1 Tax=Atlanticothrix silvestris TaxID=2840444 RepID=UPI001CED98EC|nr:transposase [Atlanticothrix silvestris]
MIVSAIKTVVNCPVCNQPTHKIHSRYERFLAWLVLRKPESQQPDSEELIALLIAQHPDLAKAINLAQGFAQIVRQRLPRKLQRWLTVAENSNLTAFRRFAKRLHEDYPCSVTLGKQ